MAIWYYKFKTQVFEILTSICHSYIFICHFIYLEALNYRNVIFIYLYVYKLLLHICHVYLFICHLQAFTTYMSFYVFILTSFNFIYVNFTYL